MLKKFLLVLLITAISLPCFATQYYVDSSVGSSGNGESWGTAWKAVTDITGLSANDTVYFSGGVSGQSYTSSDWTPPAGTSGNPITYAVGQDSGHTGMVTFTGSGNSWLTGNVHDVTFDGEVSGNIRMTSEGHSFTLYNTTSNQVQGVRFLYFQGQELFRADGATGLEIAFCNWVMPVGETNDLFFRIGYGVAGDHTSNLIHDNYIQVWRIRTQGFGQDVFKWIGDSSIYNNVIISSYSASYTGNQHNDGIQTDEDNVWVYNNYFEGFISYPIYNEMYGDCSGWRIFNNVINSNVADDASIDWSAHQSMAIGFSTTGTVSDYIITNNTMIGGDSGTGAHGPLGIHFNTGVAGTVGSGVYIVNNLFYNLGDSIIENGDAIVSNNTDAGTTNRSFISDAVYPNNDFSLQVSSTAAIDQAINPSYITDVFTTDKDGNTRSGTWDIGAYEYGEATPANTIQGVTIGNLQTIEELISWNRSDGLR